MTNHRWSFVTAITVLLSLTLLHIDTSRAQSPAGKRIALLIGVNKYEKRGFRDLEFAERDVEALADVLKTAGYDSTY